LVVSRHHNAKYSSGPVFYAFQTYPTCECFANSGYWPKRYETRPHLLETIGNATIIVYDDAKPLFVTDPWIEASPYFGSWTLSHEIPKGQKAAIKECPFVCFSHGHPDHLNPDSLPLFQGKTILLADHHKARIKNDLDTMGHTTRVLSHKTWVKLSEHVPVQCTSDYYQDAIVLIDINGRLLMWLAMPIMRSPTPKQT